MRKVFAVRIACFNLSISKKTQGLDVLQATNLQRRLLQSLNAQVNHNVRLSAAPLLDSVAEIICQKKIDGSDPICLALSKAHGQNLPCSIRHTRFVSDHLLYLYA